MLHRTPGDPPERWWRIPKMHPQRPPEVPRPDADAIDTRHMRSASYVGAGIWKRCQMFTANCGEWPSDLVAAPGRALAACSASRNWRWYAGCDAVGANAQFMAVGAGIWKRCQMFTATAAILVAAPAHALIYDCSFIMWTGMHELPAAQGELAMIRRMRCCPWRSGGTSRPKCLWSSSSLSIWVRGSGQHSGREQRASLNHAPRLAFLSAGAGARTPSIRPSGSVCINSLCNALGIGLPSSARRGTQRARMREYPMTPERVRAVLKA